VDRFPRLQVEDVDRVGILRVGHDVAVIPGPAAQAPIVVDTLPRRAAVVRAKQPAILRLDDRPHPIGLCGRDRYADLAQETAGKPGIPPDLLPGVSAVGGAPEPAALSAARQAPRRAQRFPERGVEEAWIARSDAQIDGAGTIADEQHSLPRASA